MLVVLAGALLAGAALGSPAAQARPTTVCCFRITVEVSGEAQALYTKVDRIDSQGSYDYLWGGTAYGLAHLQGSGLETDRGVAAGYLQELNKVTDGDGLPRDRTDPGCSQGEPTVSSQLGLGKTRRGSPYITLGPHGGLSFDRPFENWELNCGSLATETFYDLRDEGNADWSAPREFFSSSHINGLSAGKLAKGRSQEVTCVEQSRPPAIPTMVSRGFYAVSIKIVPFPAGDLKHQQERLTGFLGKSRTADQWARTPTHKLGDEFFAGKKVPGNGCHKG